MIAANYESITRINRWSCGTHPGHTHDVARGSRKWQGRSIELSKYAGHYPDELTYDMAVSTKELLCL